MGIPSQNAQTEVILSPEERKHRRCRVLKRGVIGFAGQYTGLECVVRDISESGARLEMNNLVALPREFVLHIEIDGYKVNCQLAWHRPPFLGVIFTSEKTNSALARKQVLGDSENALSEQFQKDFQTRINAQENSLTNASQKAKQRGSVKTAAFGKRKFEG